MDDLVEAVRGAVTQATYEDQVTVLCKAVMGLVHLS